jgi:hypothetical protein
MAIGQRQYGTYESGLPILGVYKETNDRGREERKEGTKRGERERERRNTKERKNHQF